jgi:predicted transcriptional regulator
VTATAAEPEPQTSVLRPLLLSLRPRFAEAILDGTKTVELRRTRLSAPNGTLLILYASTPVMAVVGTAVLTERDTDTPHQIWRRHHSNLALTKAEYDAYLLGAEVATAVTVASPERLSKPHTVGTPRRNQVPTAPKLQISVRSGPRTAPQHRKRAERTTCSPTSQSVSPPCRPEQCLSWRTSRQGESGGTAGEEER